jgi:hypothetical protein
VSVKLMAIQFSSMLFLTKTLPMLDKIPASEKKELLKNFDKAVKKALAEIGFKKLGTDRGFIKQINAETIGTIGISMTSKFSENIRLIPFVGVINVKALELEELARADTEYPVNRKALNNHLHIRAAYFLPESEKLPPLFHNEFLRADEWHLDKNSDIEAMVQQIATAISRYGLPFMESMGNARALYAFMSKLRSQNDYCHYVFNWRNTFPKLLFLIGERDDAYAMFKEEIQELKQSTLVSAKYDLEIIDNLYKIMRNTPLSSKVT